METPELEINPHPDRYIITAPSLSARDAYRLAQQAVRLTRSLAPKLTGQGARNIYPISGAGFFGLVMPDEHMWHNERGTKPRTMHELAGKAQPLDEMVLTPEGWRKMGNIFPGDMVIGSDGSPKEVVQVFPQGIMETYKITFSDGTSTRASKDHLWTVKRTSSGGGKRWETRTTEYIKQRLDYSWQVPCIDPIKFDGVSSLPLDPYLLGALLGDGHIPESGTPRLSSGDNIVPDEVARVLPEGIKIAKSSGHSYTITAGRRGTTSNTVSEKLKDLGLAGKGFDEKVIPAIYMVASVEDRISLLQGIMDTDGSCDKNGGLRIELANLTLSCNVADLVRGLGGRASEPRYIASRNGSRSATYVVSIKLPPTISPFRATLEKRRLRYEAYMSTLKNAQSCGKRIVSIEQVGNDEMQCILIDSDDHLYVTSGYTLTHNTIPMWIDDPTGSEAAKNPKAQRRITASGKKQILIFRRAAKHGEMKTVRRKVRGKWQTRLVNKHYPGAPGRIALREAKKPFTTPGRTPGAVAPQNVGVWWHNPGISPRMFANHAMTTVAQRRGIIPSRIYLAGPDWRGRM